MSAQVEGERGEKKRNLRETLNFEARYFMVKTKLFQKTDKSLQKINLFVSYRTNNLSINLTLDLIVEVKQYTLMGKR